MTDRDTAYHEAGHAVIGQHFGIKIESVTIAPSRDHAGLTDRENVLLRKLEEKGRDRRSLIEADLITRLAGREAERRILGEYDHSGAREDVERVLSFLFDVLGDKETTKAYFDFLEAETSRLLECPSVWFAVESVAAALIEKTSLSGDEVRAIIRNALVRKNGA